MKACGYSWGLRQIIKVSPGLAWEYLEQTDDGHQLKFDMGAVLNKVSQKTFSSHRLFWADCR